MVYQTLVVGNNTLYRIINSYNCFVENYTWLILTFNKVLYVYLSLNSSLRHIWIHLIRLRYILSF